MFQLILGSITAPKEAYLFQKVSENAKKGAYHQIILVPETLSHHAERMLCTACGDSAALQSEILTFRRLSNRVMTTYGGLAESYLDDGGRVLLMYRAYSLVRTKLTLYQQVQDTTSLLDSLLSVSEELKAAGISASDLAELGAQCEHRLKRKIEDLSIIYAAYCALCEHRDPKDILSDIADTLEEHPDFSLGTTLYIFGFSGFTPQEKRIIKNLIRFSDEVYAAFDGTTGTEPEADSIYSKPMKNAWQLRSYAADCGKRIETVILEGQTENSAFSFLEQNFFSYTGNIYHEKTDRILCYTANNPYSECEFAAANIQEAIQSDSARYRDFAVLMADPQSYRHTLEAVFERYKLPIFDGVKHDIMETPAAAFLDAALKAVTDGFDSSDIFRWLKTGLTFISGSDINCIENYCIQYDLTGSAWTTEKPWSMNPDALSAQMDDDTKERLQKINEIRTAVRTPLLQLKKKLSSKETGREKAQAFYEFLIECDLPTSLSARAEAFRGMHELSVADEYDRIWDVLCTCFDSFVDTVGDLPMTPELFGELFLLCLSRYDVSIIPTSIDRIHTGSIASIGYHRAKNVLILGVTDDVLPASGSGGGIFSDSDRTILEEMGAELSDTPALRTAEEQLALLRAFSAPLDNLIVSWAETSANGSTNRPSPYFRSLQSIFPACRTLTEEDTKHSYKLFSETAALDYALSREDVLADAMFHTISGDIDVQDLLSKSRPNREAFTDLDAQYALYGRKLRLTASRVDCSNTCPYQFFSRYGLKLNPRRKIQFDAPEAGTFLHEILEKTVRDCEHRYDRFGNTPRDVIHQIADEHVERYIADYLNNFDGKTKRFIFLFQRLKNTVYDLLDNLQEEFAHCAFRPTDFELEFGRNGVLPAISVPLSETETAEFSGVVDRVDTYCDNNTVYLRVVDYKSGTKRFSYTDLYAGLSLQMPLYLSAIEETFAEYKKLHAEFSDMQTYSDAGILYVPAKTPVIVSDCHLNEETYQKEFSSELTRSGVVTNEVSILEAMEDTVLSSPRFLPVRFNKNGTLSKTSSAIDTEQFALLKQYVRYMLTDTAKRIRTGHVEAEPICDSVQTTPCDWCDYRNCCNFTEPYDTCYMKQTVKADQFFDCAAQQKEGEETNG